MREPTGTGEYMSLNGELVEMTPAEIADLVAARTAAPPPYVITKLQIIERMTDIELNIFYTAMSAAPLRSRMLWSECQEVNSSHPMFDALHQNMVDAFGSERATAILGPSA